MIYKTDYHIHSNYSDGKASPEEFVKAALQAGLNEIGFSEHLNLFYNDLSWCIDHSRVNEYIKHIDLLKNSTDEIIVRTGFEVDYFIGREIETYNYLSPLKLDYIIGSVHYMGDSTVDNGREFYNGKDIDRLYIDYFDIVCEAISSGLFDFIAHLDLIKIFGFKYSRDPEPLYRHLAEKMARHYVALEINTNGKNKPVGEYYPDIRFLHLFKEAGVPVCVNSDAHYPARVGENFDDVYKILKAVGYNEMCTFRNRERYIVPAEF